jgi:hypothetical protein
MSGRASLRASDADRERVAERLRHAATEGRLLPEELDDRLGATFSARTYGELDPLVADLPSASLDRRRHSRELGRARPKVALIVIAALVVAIVGAVVSSFGGHGHGYHHGFGGIAVGPIIWAIWIAIALRLVLRRRQGLR